MPRIRTDSVSLYYELNGKGPVVVFINGLTMDLNGWLFQVEPFGKRFTVLRYDCRGQGSSDKPDAEYSQEMHAEDLYNLLRELNIQRAHIVGLSNGGMIAQHFALLYPEMAGALVLVDTCSHIDTLLELMIKSWIKATEAGGSGLRYDVALPMLFSEEFTKKNIDKILAMKEINIITNPARAVINLANASLRHNLLDRVSGIKSPTLIVVGEKDILIPPKYSMILNQKIKNSRLAVLKGCAHVPPIEKPEEFNALVMDFLDENKELT